MLSDYLYTLREINVFFNLFNYISFRAGISLVTSLFFVILLMPYWIKFQYKIFPLGQPIREDGPSTHLSKRGTPTFGGILIIISIIVSSILWTSEFSKFNYILILTLILFGFIGFYDDYQKVRTKKGISSINKFTLQILFTIIIYFSILFNGFDLDNFFIPFLKNVSLDLGFFYFFLILFIIIGSTNATNLTDGLDGLVSMPLIFVFLTFAVFAYILGNINFSNYLLINYIPGSGEIVIFCTSAIGGILGFLWFNSSPASIFMGDTGSLSLGGSLGAVGIITKHEIVLAITGGLFVLEALSVMVQVISFKLTGKRIFRMAPIHHHFEKKGWPESTVVIRFWIISIILAMIGLATLKLR